MTPQFTYSPWRHGGWYVHGVRYPNGAIGCVSRNYADRKWRIACDPRPFEERPTFRTRDAAARAEWELARKKRAPDFIMANHGTILLLTPMSEEAKQWVGEHLPADAQTFGRGVAIEPRYWAPIQEGIEADGLTIK